MPLGQDLDPERVVDQLVRDPGVGVVDHVAVGRVPAEDGEGMA